VEIWRPALAQLEAELVLYGKTEELLRTIDKQLLVELGHPANLFGILMTGVLELLEAREGQLLLSSGEAPESPLEIVWTTGSEPIGTQVTVGDTVCGKAVQTKQAVVIDDVAVEPRYTRLLGSPGAPIKSELAIPVVDDTGKGPVVLGVINVESSKVAAFGPRQISVLTLVAGQAAIALRQAQLQRHFGDVVHQLGKLVRESWPLTKTLHFIWDSLQKLVPHADHCQILLREYEQLSIIYTTGNEAPGTRVDIADSISGQAVEEQKVINLGDVSKSARYKPVLPGMHSELAVPAILAGEVVALINLESRRISAFTGYDEYIVQLFADHAALAISMSKRINDLDVMRRRHIGLASLAHVGDIAGNMIHRFTNLLGPIPVWIQEIEKKNAEDLKQKPPLHKRLTEIKDVVVQALDLGRQMMRRVSEGSKAVEINIPAIIAEAVKSSRLSDTVKVNVTCPPDIPSIFYPKEDLVEVLRNIIKNASEAMQGTGTVSINVREWVSQHRPGKPKEGVEIHIVDDGPGADNESLGEMFSPGFTSRGTSGGLGYGLWWVRTTVDLWGGNVWAKRNSGRGLTVGLMLLYRMTTQE